MLSVWLALAAILESPEKLALTTISDASRPPPGWVAIPPPRTEREWYCANYSDDLSVVKVGEAVQILAGTHYVQPTLSLPMGTFVGTNGGEFGGQIEWHDRATGLVTTVRRDNPVAFLSQNSRVFVFVGLAHLSMDEGELLELKLSKKGRWTASSLMKLGAAPDAILPLGGSEVLVLTTTGVLKVNLATHRMTRVNRNMQWFLIYANSIAQLNDSIMIGARRAIVRLRPEGGRLVEEWWVKSDCRQQVGESCRCQP